MQNKMLVKRVLFFAAILMLGAAIGCARKKASDEAITIRYTTFEYLPTQRALIRKIIDAFEKENPGIKIKDEFTPNSSKILVELAGGAGPDVFYWCNLTPLVAKRTITDLTSFIRRDNFDLERYFPAVLDAFRYNNGLYGLPIHFGVGILVYNKDLFDKEGLKYPDENWTWNDMLIAAKALTKDTDGDGRTDQFGIIPPHPIYLILMNTGGLFNEEMTQCLLNSPAAVEALQFAMDLRNKYGVSPSVHQARERGELPLFLAGNVGMIDIGAFALGELSNIKNFNWDVTLPPSAAEGKERTVNMAAGGICISEQSRHKEEAWKFIKFYCSEKGVEILAGARNCIPAIKSVAESPLFCFSPPENIRGILKMADYARVWPKWEGWDEFGSIFEMEIEKALIGDKTPVDAAKEMTVKANALLLKNE